MAPNSPAAIDPAVGGNLPTAAGRGFSLEELQRRAVIAREQVLASMYRQHSQVYDEWWREWSFCVAELAVLRFRSHDRGR